MSSKAVPLASRWRQLNLKQLTVVWVLTALAVSYLAQVNYDSWRRYSPPKLVGVDYNVYIEPQPLSPPLARGVSFGATEFVADYYWLTLIQYYGGGTPNGYYRKLAELFNLVTDLSPQFSQAYQTGLIILPGEKFADEAIALGEKGKRNLPDSWEMPYYTGLVYHIYKKDYVAAGREFELAASKAGAPAITRYLAGVYYKEGDQRQIAYQIFQTVAQTATDDFVRDRAEKQLVHLDITFFLEDAASKFHQKYGRYPTNLQELVTKGIIKEIPTSPLNFGFTIDAQTGKVSDAKGQ